MFKKQKHPTMQGQHTAVPLDCGGPWGSECRQTMLGAQKVLKWILCPVSTVKRLPLPGGNNNCRVLKESKSLFLQGFTQFCKCFISAHYEVEAAAKASASNEPTFLMSFSFSNQSLKSCCYNDFAKLFFCYNFFFKFLY